MKVKELKSLNEKSEKELSKLVREKKIEVLNSIGKTHAGKEKNLKKARNLRREIAQILTLLKNKGGNKR